MLESGAWVLQLGHISSSVAFDLRLMNWVSPHDRMRIFNPIQEQYKFWS